MKHSRDFYNSGFYIDRNNFHQKIFEIQVFTSCFKIVSNLFQSCFEIYAAFLFFINYYNAQCPICIKIWAKVKILEFNLIKINYRDQNIGTKFGKLAPKLEN